MILFQLVLPCYNEVLSLIPIIERAKTAALKAGLKEGEFQLVMVENGSKDSSRQKFNELLLNENLAPWFKMVPIDQNQGYGYGVMTGLSATESPVIGWSHADQQCDPADAIQAYFKLMEAKSIGKKIFVKGTRSGRNWKDIIVSRVFEILARLILGINVHEMNAQPKVFDRDLLSQLNNPPKTFAFDLYVLYHVQKLNIPIHTIPVNFPPRVHGFSNWSSHFLSRYKTILGIIKYMYFLKTSEGRI